MGRAINSCEWPVKYSYYQQIDEGHHQPVYCVVMNDVDPLLNDVFASVGSNLVTIYRLPDVPDDDIKVEQRYKDEDTNETFWSCVWAQDIKNGNPLIVCGGILGVIKVINCKQQKATLSLQGHVGAINELRRSPTNASIIASASNDRSVRLWNVITGVCIAVFTGEAGHLNEALSVDFNFQGDKLVTCGMDHTIKIWNIDESIQELIQRSFQEMYQIDDNKDLPKPSPVFPLKIAQFPVFSTDKIHNDYVDCVRFWGNFILSKSCQDKVVLWEPVHQRSVVSHSCPVNIIQEFALSDCRHWFIRFSFNPTMQFFAVGNASGRIFLFDLENFESKPRTVTSNKSNKIVRSIAFSEDSRFLITANEDATVKVWKINDDQ